VYLAKRFPLEKSLAHVRIAKTATSIAKRLKLVLSLQRRYVGDVNLGLTQAYCLFAGHAQRVATTAVTLLFPAAKSQEYPQICSAVLRDQRSVAK